MAIFNFNKVRSLEIENEELKTRLFLLKTKEDNQTRLEEVLKKLRNSVSELNETKSVLIDEIDNSQKKIQKQKEQISSLQNDISRLNKQKELHQNDILELSNKLNQLKDQAAHSTITKNPNIEELKADEERVERLRNEQTALENKIDLITKRINELNIQELELIESVELRNKEVLSIEQKNISGNQKTISDIELKISKLKSQETDLLKRIEQLTRAEESKKQILDDLEEQLGTTHQKIDALKLAEESQKQILTELDKKLLTSQEEIDQLALAEESKKQILDELERQLNATNQQAGGLSLKRSTLDRDIQDKLKLFSDTEESYQKLNKQTEFARKELEQLQSEIKNTNQQFSISIQKLNETELKIKDLEEIERARKNILTDLSLQLNNLQTENKNLESKNIFLMRDNETKAKQLADIEKNYLLIQSQFDSTEKQLEKIKSELDFNQNKLNHQLEELKNSEIELTALREEKKRIEDIKADFQLNFDSAKNELNKIVEQKTKINEMVQLLEQRKSELEQTNSAIENRFSKIFQKFNIEYNDLMKKKTLLDQIAAKKDKDVAEKDQQLFEKISALEESERILSMRQAEIDSFQQLLKTINEQKELLKNELLKLDAVSLEKKSYNEDLKLESELLLKKKITIEQTLQEVINAMTDRFEKIKDRRTMLDDDINNYELKLTTLRNQLEDSRKALIEVENSISTRKIEHEDHNGQVAKLITMKKKLEEEIANHQVVLQKYQKIREKLKIEQALIKSRRDASAKTNEELSDAENSINEDERSKIFKL